MEKVIYKMIYKIEKTKTDGFYKVLGEEFVENNKDKAKLIINNKIYELSEKIRINNLKNGYFIKVKLIFFNDIFDRSFMFDGCDTLIKILDSQIIKNKFEINLNSNGNLFNNFITDEKYNNCIKTETSDEIYDEEYNSSISNIWDVFQIRHFQKCQKILKNKVNDCNFEN